MRCPFCQHEDTQVRDSRPTEEGAAIRRRRQCGKCGARFTTFERVQLRELVVIKRSTGRQVPFEREKLTRSIKIALNKRPVNGEAIEQMVSGIVRQLENRGEAEIPSHTIGELVMEALAAVDPVAYVRYASVYKDFGAAGDFGKFLDEHRLGGEKSDDAA